MSSSTLESELSSSTVTRSIGDVEYRLPPRELITPAEIAAHARRPQTRRRLLAALEHLENDDSDSARIAGYQTGLAESPGGVQPLDTVAIAHAAAELLRPRRALEIGVARGFCAAAIASAATDVELHLIDRWRATDLTPSDASAPHPAANPAPHPGPALVRRQLQAVGHHGNAHFHQGDSHVLLPQLCLPHHHRAMSFDLVIVDGDRTEAGADQDLRDIFPHIARGGLVVFDDLSHPDHACLLDVWNRWQSSLSDQFCFAEHLTEGSGVGCAMRIAG